MVNTAIFLGKFKTLGASWNKIQLAPLGKFKTWGASWILFQLAQRASANQILMSNPASYILIVCKCNTDIFSLMPDYFNAIVTYKNKP